MHFSNLDKKAINSCDCEEITNEAVRMEMSGAMDDLSRHALCHPTKREGSCCS